MIPSPTLSPRSLADQIREAVEHGRITLPPLPELATRLLSTLRDPGHADLGRVGELIEKDQALSASVLRMANSAMFGGLHPIDTLSQAAARLGLRQITTMVTLVSHRGHFVSNDAERASMLRALWEHALATASGTRRLAVRGGGDRAEAFLAGLLHDVGKLLVLKGVDDLDSRPGAPHVPPEVIDELMASLHCELGPSVLNAWKLPKALANVALRHHEAEPDEMLVVRVQVANALAHRLGFSLHPRPGLDMAALPGVQRIGLEEEDIQDMEMDVNEEVEQALQML